MGIHRKPIERRTFSQDRYYALIKKQKEGKATFEQLTELDEIVNRDPTIREKVILESLNADDMDDFEGPQQNDKMLHKPVPKNSFWSWLKSLANQVTGYLLLPATTYQPTT